MNTLTTQRIQARQLAERNGRLLGLLWVEVFIFAIVLLVEFFR